MTDVYRLDFAHYVYLKIKFILVIVKEAVTCFKVSEGITYSGGCRFYRVTIPVRKAHGVSRQKCRYGFPPFYGTIQHQLVPL